MIERVTEPVHILCFFSDAPVYAASPCLDTVSLQPRWLRRALDRQAGVSFAAGLSVGEVSGVGPQGAWVACRRPVEGGVQCASVGRWEELSDAISVFCVGSGEAEAQVRTEDLEGIGKLGVASAVVPGGTMSEPFHAHVGGIPAGRSE